MRSYRFARRSFLAAVGGAFGLKTILRKGLDFEPLPEPPPPQGEASEEPGVRIPVQEGDKIEEIRDGEEVIMLKVTPKDGPTYYLVQTAKGGWARRDSLDDGVRVPMWPIHKFD